MPESTGLPDLSQPLTEASVAAARAQFAVLRQLERAARRSLPEPVWEFLAGGSGDEETLRDNEAAFARWRWRPRVLAGTGGVDLNCTLLGMSLAAPVLVAPFGVDGVFHPDGYCAVVAGCGAGGVVGVVPSSCSYSLEDVRAAAPDAARIFQLAPTEPELMRWLVKRAESAGYEALCLTVDQPVIGWREHTRMGRFHAPAPLVSGNTAVPGGPGVGQPLGSGRPWLEWSWDSLAEFLAASTSLPFLVKGVLTAADAREAVRVGAAAVVVSNHGGRQLHGAPATLDQLPEVSAAVRGQVPVLLDSGIRRGSDVVKALALGADAVLIGRSAVFGLVAAGAAGVLRTLELYVEEIRTTMALIGRRRPADLDAELLQPAR